MYLQQKVLKSLVGDAKNVAESAKKVEDVTSFLKKGLSAKADVKNVMNVVSVRQRLYKFINTVSCNIWKNNK